MMHPLTAQAARFAAVSGSGTAVNLGAFTMMTALGSPPALSAAVAFLLACGHNFALHRRITFARLAPAGALGPLRFLVLSTVTLGVNLGALAALQHAGLPLPLAQAGGIAVASPLNFLGSRTWVFAQKPALYPSQHSSAEAALA